MKDVQSYYRKHTETGYKMLHSSFAYFVAVGWLASNSLRLHGLQLAKLLYPPLSPRTCSNSCLLSWWCHPTIASSAAPSSLLLLSHIFILQNSCFYLAGVQPRESLKESGIFKGSKSKNAFFFWSLILVWIII